MTTIAQQIQTQQDDQRLKLAIMTAVRMNVSTATNEYIGSVELQKGFTNQDALGAVNILNEVSTKLNIQGAFSFDNSQIVFHGRAQFNKQSLIATLDTLKDLSKLSNVIHVKQLTSAEKLLNFDARSFVEKNAQSSKALSSLIAK